MRLGVLLLLGWVAWDRIVLHVHTVWLLHEIRKDLMINHLLLLSIVIYHHSTLVLIEDVILRVHHVRLKGLIVVWILMLSLNLLLHALTQVHDLKLHLLLMLMLPIITLLSPGNPSLSMWPLIVPLNLGIPAVVVISVVFVGMRRRRLILATLAMIKILRHSRSRLAVVREDHGMWILKVRGARGLRIEDTGVSKGLRLKVEVWRYWRGQEDWWEVLRGLEISYRIVCSRTMVWTV